MAMVNAKQMKALVEQLTKDLGREPYSTELLAAINGYAVKKENEQCAD